MDTPTHSYAGIFLYLDDGRLIGQQRDDKPGIDNPGKIATFGGTVEPGESPLQAARREVVQEETNLKLKKEDLHLFLEDVSLRQLTREYEKRYFYRAKITQDQLDHLTIYEGQGWAEIHGADDPNLVESWKPVVAAFMAKK